LGLAEALPVCNDVLKGSQLCHAFGPDLEVQYFSRQQVEHLTVQLRITLEVRYTGQLFDALTEARLLFERD
jgi:hypothetical protein